MKDPKVSTRVLIICDLRILSETVEAADGFIARIEKDMGYTINQRARQKRHNVEVVELDVLKPQSKSSAPDRGA